MRRSWQKAGSAVSFHRGTTGGSAVAVAALLLIALLLMTGLGVAMTARIGASPALLRAADVAYGPDRLQRADIYAEAGLAGAPVAIFFHGGAYAFGDKNEGGGRWGNVATAFARAGLVAINADYRLAPRATWPSGLRDVGRLAAWARAHVTRWGGDPRRIVLVGHSAGATHVAAYVLDRRFEPGGDPEVAGAILVSGRYTLAPRTDDPNLRQVLGYFGRDPSALADRAPVSRVATATRLPLMVVVAGREHAGLAGSAQVLIRALCARDDCPVVARVAGRGHWTEMSTVGTSADALGPLMTRFIRGVAPH